MDKTIYDRAIAHYPHLATIKDERTLCRQLCRLATVPTITAAEYWQIAAIAESSGIPKQTPQDRYAAKAIRRYALNLNRNTDADILEHLEKLDNVQGYIKALIRSDMEHQTEE